MHTITPSRPGPVEAPVRPTGVEGVPRGTDWGRVLTRAAGAVTVVGVVVLLLCSGLLPEHGPEAADLVSYPTEVLAILACVPVLRASRGRTQVAWGLVCSLLVVWFVADLLWLAAEWVPAASGLDRPATVLYLLGAVPVGLALFVVPVGRWEQGAAVRVVLDVLVLSLALLAAADVLVLRDVVEQTRSQDAVVTVVYPICDVLLASGALALSRRLAGRPRTDLLLAAAAFGVYAVTDLGYSWVELRQVDYFTTPLAAGYTIGPMLLGLAALAARRDLVEAATRPLQRYSRARTLSVLPDLAVLSAGVVCIAVPPRTWHEWTLVVLGATAALVRSVLTESDSATLRADLEERVEQRTKALVSLGDRNRRILASVTEGIAGVDESGAVIFVNESGRRLLADSEVGLLGRSACELLGAHGPAGCPVHDVLRAGGSVTALGRTLGRDLPVEVTASRMVAGSGSTEVVVCFRDLSEREEVETLKREFVTAVSHELRTPLSAIRGALELLADGDAGVLPPAAGRLVDTADRGSRRLARLVDDIIDVERLAAGTFDVSPRSGSVAPLLEHVAEVMAPLAEQSGVVLAVGRTTWQPALVDPDRVEQVLANLVGNSVKFSPRGSTVTLGCRVVDAPAGPEVVVEVGDEGRGIPPEDLPHVFEPFRQVSVADGRTLGGAGLGLAIARSIVELHGGRIWVTSELGRGTTFHFSLPVVAASSLAG